MKTSRWECVEAQLELPRGYLSAATSLPRAWLLSEPATERMILTDTAMRSCFVLTGHLFSAASMVGPTPHKGIEADTCLCFPEFSLGKRWRLGTVYRTAKLDSGDMFGFVGLDQHSGVQHVPEDVAVDAELGAEDGFANHLSRWLYDAETMTALIYSRLRGGFHLCTMHLGPFGLRKEVAVVATDTGILGDVLQNTPGCDFCHIRGSQCECDDFITGRRFEAMYGRASMGEQVCSPVGWTFPDLHLLQDPAESPRLYQRQRLDSFFKKGPRDLKRLPIFFDFIWANDERCNIYTSHCAKFLQHAARRMTVRDDLILEVSETLAERSSRPHVDHTPTVPVARKRAPLKRVCEYCGKRFTTASNLSRHTATVHLSASKHTCDLCIPPVSFSQKVNYLRHVKEIHEGVKPYVCSDCGIDFSRKHDHKRHLEICPKRSLGHAY
mmetsp:Transcript_41947/g.103240  ORF Transcript_41947/g.103240 Transcript_41947/m.103240 type:complete len:439 (+) Transcript_41947:51-1367(+)